MPPRRRSLLWPLLFLGLAGGVFGLARCQPTRVPSDLAEVVLQNLASASWELRFARVSGAEAVVVRVPPRSEERVRLPAGAYLVEQRLLDIRGTSVDHRSLRWEALAGQAYAWPLVTLQSTSPEEDMR